MTACPVQSQTSASAAARKQQSRQPKSLEQRQITKEQERIGYQSRYFTRQDELRSQFLKICLCNIDNYDKNIVKGDDIENNRYRLKK